jgi:hypothetical protein
MKMTSAEFREHTENYMGYCKACDDMTTDSVEPDAEGYTCDSCEKNKVMGAEQAMMMGLIEIDDAAKVKAPVPVVVIEDAIPDDPRNLTNAQKSALRKMKKIPNSVKVMPDWVHTAITKQFQYDVTVYGMYEAVLYLQSYGKDGVCPADLYKKVMVAALKSI